MTGRPFSFDVAVRVCEDAFGPGAGRHFQMLPYPGRHWLPFMVFGALAFPFGPGRVLLYRFVVFPSAKALAESIMRKFLEQEPLERNLSGLTRAETDYLDRLDAEVPQA